MFGCFHEIIDGILIDKYRYVKINKISILKHINQNLLLILEIHIQNLNNKSKYVDPNYNIIMTLI